MNYGVSDHTFWYLIGWFQGIIFPYSTSNSLPGGLFDIKMSGGSSYSLGVIFVSSGIFGYNI